MTWSRFLTMFTVIMLSLGFSGVARSAQPTRSLACREDVAALRAEDLGYTDLQIAAYTGCSRDINGGWFWSLKSTNPMLATKVGFIVSERTTIDEWRIE